MNISSVKNRAKKRVGIITIVDNNNYGNRLQNYAVKRVYELLGFSSDTLILNQRKGNIKYLFRAYKMVKSELQKKKYDLHLRKRISRFEEFNSSVGIRIKKYPLWSKMLLRMHYDFFSVGSDQIWNPDLNFGYGTEFLTFAKKEQRITFSPSLGTEHVRQDKIPSYIKGLKGFKYLSVREKSGAEIIRNLTGQKAEVLIDPTMMLAKEEWMKIEKKPKHLGLSMPYILEYFLGGKDDVIEREISSYAKEQNLSRVILLDKNNPELFCVDPAEFVYLIHHANLIVTDSFHACVFSILFDRPFAIYPRRGHAEMSSRIFTLFNLFGNNSLNMVGLRNIMHFDERKVSKILAIERQKVCDFLKKELCINE